MTPTAPQSTTGTYHGQSGYSSTIGNALKPKERKRKTITLLEDVASGKVTPKKAFELLKEIV